MTTLNPVVIAFIFAARLVLSTLYLTASYLCSRSKSLFLVKICNTIRALVFCLDNRVLLGLLLNYGASTVSTLVHCVDTGSSWPSTFGCFGLICILACCVSPFLADKAKLTRLFSVNVSVFILILLLWVLRYCHRALLFHYVVM